MSPPSMADFRSPSDPASVSFNAGRPASARPKARFFKHKRSSKPPSSSASFDSGINPFRVPNSGGIAADANVGLEQGNLRGVGNEFWDSKTSEFKNDGFLCKEESFFSDYKGVAFVFRAGVKFQHAKDDAKCGESGPEVELAEGIKNINIKHREKGSSVERDEECNNVELSSNGEPFFVFKSSVKDSDVFCGTSTTLKGEGKGEDLNEKKIDSDNDGKVDENIFLFTCGESREPGASSSNSSAFVSDGNGMKSDVLSSSFSFLTSGSQVDKGNPEVGPASSEKNADSVPTTILSSAEFRIPEFASSLSFSANGLDSKNLGQRSRAPKDKTLTKTRGKLKHSKPSKKQPLQKPESSQCASHEEETPGSYSPMDFSPYEDTTNHDVPSSVHQTTDPTKVKNENSYAPYAEVQSNLGCMSSGFGVASTGSSANVSSNISGHDGNGSQFYCGSNLASRVAETFAFTASGSAQNHISSVKRQHKKKYRTKNANACGTRDTSFSSTPMSNRQQSHGTDFYASEKKDKPQTGGDQQQDYVSTLSEAEKGCDKWRRRGNEAYEKGELSKAEDFYTWGVNCIPPGDESGVTFRPLVRCYSNRAATRMALGRVGEAILDCLAAVKMDPTFHRAQMRAANCYLLLGELEEAKQCFGKLMESTNTICLDRQIVISASEGIQKSQKVMECMSCCAEILKLRTTDAAAKALEVIAEALSISLYSEQLLEMKAEALCMLGKHDEAITLCQQSLDLAEKNFTAMISVKHQVNNTCSDVSLWRCRVLSKCYFHLGRLEAALDFLDKPEFANKTPELPYQLAVTIRELLKLKNAGNAAFQSGKHAEAVEQYTSAIMSSMESRPFAAICFCNRAAAHQALGQVADAIADCSLAIALNEDYAKAVSRRATLHEMIRDYKQAAVDLQRLVSLLEKQSHKKPKQSGSGNGKELRQVQQRLSSMEEEAKKDVPLDLYLILGTKKSDPASEIKKAYRRAALRHHPDKACQSLVRSDAGDDGHRWKDIANLVHKDSDRLFKTIGEAYAVLSDPTKREEYDHSEDMRKALKESNDLRRTSRRNSEYYSQCYPFERSSNRRHWQDHYKTYPHRRW